MANAILRDMTGGRALCCTALPRLEQPVGPPVRRLTSGRCRWATCTGRLWAGRWLVGCCVGRPWAELTLSARPRGKESRVLDMTDYFMMGLCLMIVPLAQ